MEKSESFDELTARHDQYIERALNEYGNGSTPVFASILRKYYELQQYSIFSKIDVIKSEFSSGGGADKIVRSVESSIIKFNRYETDEELVIPFLSSAVIENTIFSKETIIAASLYLLYVRKVIDSKYRQVADARSKLVSALTAKNLGQVTTNEISPTDPHNKDSELSKLSRLKGQLKKIPDSFLYLQTSPKINPELKIYVDEIPAYFPNVDIYSVYLAASLWLDESNFEMYSNLSLEERFQFESLNNSILPIQTWKYWLDDVEELFDLHFKSADAHLSDVSVCETNRGT